MLIYESEPRLERVRGFLGDAKASFLEESTYLLFLISV